MATNLLTYSRNVARSLGYVAVDIVKEANPVIKSFADENAELGKELYAAVKDYRGTYNKIKSEVEKSTAFATANHAIQYFFEDIRTGNFYNRERMHKADLAMTGSDKDDDFGDDDWGFDDSVMDFGPDDFDESGEDYDVDFDEVGEKITTGTAAAIATSTNVMVKASQDAVKAVNANNNMILGQIQSGMGAMNANLSSLVGIIEPLNQTMQNTKQFMEDVMTIQAESRDLLKQLVENTSRPSKPEAKEKERYDWNYISGSDDVINIKSYVEAVTNNIKEATSSISALNSMFGEGTNIMETMISSPISSLIKVAAESIIPSVMKNSMELMNNSLQGFFGAAIQRINNLGQRSDNPILGWVSKIFGIKDTMKTSLDTGKYEKGRVDWDGKSRKALIEVIPTYLRQIVALLSGEEENVFDYEQGKFRRGTDVAKEYQSKRKSGAQSASSNVREELSKVRDKMKFRTLDEKERFDKDMENFFQYLYDNSTQFDYNDKNATAMDYGMSNRSSLEFLRAFYKNLRKSGKGNLITRMDSDILYQRSQFNRQMQDIEKTGDSVLATLWNGSNDFNSRARRDHVKEKDKYENKLADRIGLGRLDNLGHDIFWYLQDFYKSLHYMRDMMNVDLGSIMTRLGPGGDNAGPATTTTGPQPTPPSGPPTAQDILKQKLLGNPKIQARMQKGKNQNTSSIPAYLVGASNIPTPLNIDANGISIPKGNNIRRDPEEIEKENRRRARETYEQKYAKQKEEDEKILKSKNKNNKKKSSGVHYVDDVLAMSEDRDLGSLVNIIYAEMAAQEKIEKAKEQEDTFLQRMVKTKSLGEKYQVLADKVDHWMQAPGEVFLSSVQKLDQKLFDFIYGEPKDEKEPRSFFESIQLGLQDMFAKVNDFLDEKIFKKLYEKFGADSFGDLVKKGLGAIGIDVDAMKGKAKGFLFGTKDEDGRRSGGILGDTIQSFKDSMGGAFGWVNEAFQEYLQDAENAIKKAEAEWKKNHPAEEGPKVDAREAAAQAVISQATSSLSGINEKMSDEENNTLNAINAALGTKNMTNQERIQKAADAATTFQGMGNQRKRDRKRMIQEELLRRENIKNGSVEYDPNDPTKSKYDAKWMANYRKELSNALEPVKSQVFMEFHKARMMMKPSMMEFERNKLLNRAKLASVKLMGYGADALKDPDFKKWFDENVVDNPQSYPDSMEGAENYQLNQYQTAPLNLDDPRNNSKYQHFAEKYGKERADRAFGLSRVHNSTVAGIASGGIVKRTGIAAVSEGEMIIPSKYNPFYRGGSSQLQQSKREDEAIARFFGKFANGTASVGDQPLNDDGTAEVDTSEAASQKVMDAVKAGKDKIISAAEAGKDAAADVGRILKESSFAQSVADELRGFASSFGRMFFGDPSKDPEKVLQNDKNYQRVIEDVKANVPDYAGSMMAGGLIGGGVSLLTGLLGGPLLGAAVGAGTSLVLKSQAVQDFLFGEVDANGDPTGGLLSRDTSMFLKNTFPGMAKGGAVGGVLSILPFVPGGPITGMLVGSAVGYLKQSSMFQDFLFGEDGIIGKDMANKTKAALPKMAAGALLGAMFGPLGGLLPNIMLGTAVGFASNSEKFQDIVFGEADEKGERHGGVLDRIHDWMKTDIFDPVKNAFKPLTKYVELMARSIVQGAKGALHSAMTWVGRALFRRISESWLGRTVGKAGKAAFGAAKGVAKGVISAPFKAIGALGEGARRSLIRRGGADFMTAEERLAYRDQHKIGFMVDRMINPLGRAMGGAKAGRWKKADETLAEMGLEDLEGLRGQLNALRSKNSEKSSAEVVRAKYMRQMKDAMLNKKSGLKGKKIKKYLDQLEKAKGNPDTISRIVSRAMAEIQDPELAKQVQNAADKMMDQEGIMNEANQNRQNTLERLKGMGFNFKDKNLRNDEQMRRLLAYVNGEIKDRQSDEEESEEDKLIEEQNAVLEERHDQLIDALHEIRDAVSGENSGDTESTESVADKINKSSITFGNSNVKRGDDGKKYVKDAFGNWELAEGDAMTESIVAKEEAAVTREEELNEDMDTTATGVSTIVDLLEGRFEEDNEEKKKSWWDNIFETIFGGKGLLGNLLDKFKESFLGKMISGLGGLIAPFIPQFLKDGATTVIEKGKDILTNLGQNAGGILGAAGDMALDAGSFMLTMKGIQTIADFAEDYLIDKHYAAKTEKNREKLYNEDGTYTAEALMAGPEQIQKAMYNRFGNNDLYYYSDTIWDKIKSGSVRQFLEGKDMGIAHIPGKLSKRSNALVQDTQDIYKRWLNSKPVRGGQAATEAVADNADDIAERMMSAGDGRLFGRAASAADDVVDDVVRVMPVEILDSSGNVIAKYGDDAAMAATNAIDDVGRMLPGPVNSMGQLGLPGPVANSIDDVGKMLPATTSGSTALAVVGSNTDDVLKAATSSVDDIGRTMANSADDVVRAATGAAPDIITQSADDVVSAVANNADEVMEAGFKSGFMKHLNSMMQWLAKKFPKAAAGLSKVSAELGAAAGKLFGKNLAIAGLKVSPAGLAFAINDFTIGFQNARTILGITETPSIAQRGFAGIYNMLLNQIPFVGPLLKPDYIMSLLVEYVAPAFGFGDELREQRARALEELDAYNAEHNTHFNLEEYNKNVLGDYTIQEKIGQGIRVGWSKTKEFVGGGIDKAKEAVGNVISGAKEGIGNVITNVKTGVGNAIGSAKEGIGNAIGAVKGGIGNAIDFAKEYGSPFAKEILRMNKDGLTAMKGGIKEYFNVDNQLSEDNPLRGLATGIGTLGRITGLPRNLLFSVGAMAVEGGTKFFNDTKEFNNALGRLMSNLKSNYQNMEQEPSLNMSEGNSFYGIGKAAASFMKIGALPGFIIGGIASKIGDGVKNWWTGTKTSIKNSMINYGTASLEINDLAKSGNIEAYKNYKYEEDPENPLGGFTEGLINAQHAIHTPIVYLFSAGKKLGDWWKNTKNSIRNNAMGYNSAMLQIDSLAKTGNIDQYKAYEYQADPNNPVGGFTKSAIDLYHTTHTPIVYLHAAANSLADWWTNTKAAVRNTAVNYGTAMIQIHNLAKTGDIEQYKAYEFQADPNNPIGGFTKGLINLEHTIQTPVVYLHAAGNKLGDWWTDTKTKIKNNAAGYVSATTKINQLAKEGDINKYKAYEFQTDADNPVGGFTKGIISLYHTAHTPFVYLHAAGKKIGEFWDSIKTTDTNFFGTIGNYVKTLNSYTDTTKSMDNFKKEKMGTSDGIMGIINNILGGLIRNVMSVYVNLVRGFKNMGAWIADKIPFGDFVKKAKGKADQFMEWLYNLGKKDETSATKVGAGSGLFISQRGKSAKQKFGDSTIEAEGCGPAAAAMAVGGASALNNAASYAVNNGYKKKGGVSADYFGSYFASKGMGSDYSNSRSHIKENIKHGKPTVLLGQDSGNKSKLNSPFGPGSHYVTATGMDKHGNIIVNDPELNGPRPYDAKILDKAKVGISALKGGASNILGAAKSAAAAATANSGVKAAKKLVKTSSSAAQKAVTNTRNTDAANARVNALTAMANNANSKNAAVNQSTYTNEAYQYTGGTYDYTSGTTATNATAVNTTTGDYIGKHVAQFESGNKGSAMISSGKGDNGGVSFGSYQFPSYKQTYTTKGSLPEFWNKYFGSTFPGVKPGNNEAFKAAWVQAVNMDPAGFFQKEHEYIAEQYYVPIRNKLASMAVANLDQYDRGLQEAAWSSAVQYGPSKAASIIKDAVGGSVNGQLPANVINKIQDYKVSHVSSHYKSSSASVQKGVANRHNNGERQILLGLAGQAPIDYRTTNGANGAAGATVGADGMVYDNNGNLISTNGVNGTATTTKEKENLTMWDFFDKLLNKMFRFVVGDKVADFLLGPEEQEAMEQAQGIVGYDESGNPVYSTLDGTATTTTGASSTGTSNMVTGANGADMANNFPFLLQSDPRWGSHPYDGGKGGTVSSSGCGPTSMAMVLRSFGHDVTPAQTADWSKAHGFRTPSSGTAHGYFKAIAQTYGLNGPIIGEGLGNMSNVTPVANALSSNKAVIASMSKGHFTKGGHFIVLSSIDGQGNVTVNDPSSRERTNKKWPLNLVISEGKKYWSFDQNGVGSIGGLNMVQGATNMGNTVLDMAANMATDVYSGGAYGSMQSDAQNYVDTSTKSTDVTTKATLSKGASKIGDMVINKNTSAASTAAKTAASTILGKNTSTNKQTTAKKKLVKKSSGLIGMGSGIDYEQFGYDMTSTSGNDLFDSYYSENYEGDKYADMSGGSSRLSKLRGGASDTRDYTQRVRYIGDTSYNPNQISESEIQAKETKIEEFGKLLLEKLTSMVDNTAKVNVIVELLKDYYSKLLAKQDQIISNGGQTATKTSEVGGASDVEETESTDPTNVIINATAANKQKEDDGLKSLVEMLTLLATQ